MVDGRMDSKGGGTEGRQVGGCMHVDRAETDSNEFLD